jgi:hypothetical protein
MGNLMHNQDRRPGAVPKDAATPREGALSATGEVPDQPERRGEARDVIDGISIERWHERNVYHRQAMESRRSIQMKVFTGCIVLLLGLAKGGIDVLTGIGATDEIRVALILGSLAVPIFLFFFMLQIEFVNKKNRERYHFYEGKLDGHFYKGESDTAPEGWVRALFRSWAATWPVLATLCLALLVAYTINNVEIKRSPTESLRAGSVVEKSRQPKSDSGLAPRTEAETEK